MLRCVSRALAPGLLALFVLAAPALGGEWKEATGPDGVGRLICAAPGGRARVEDGSGWVVGAADTVVTAAHILFPAGGAADPRSCTFRLYAPDGTVRAAARVRYVRSPWSDPAGRNDSSQDVAVLKLDRPMPVEPLPLAARGRGPGAQPVRLLSFPGDGGDAPSQAAGEARAFPLGPVRDAGSGMRVSDPGRLFASTAASAPGSSGGLYLAARGGGVVGLHIGRLCDAAECFGFGLRFDSTIVAMVAAVALDEGAMPVRLASR